MRGEEGGGGGGGGRRGEGEVCPGYLCGLVQGLRCGVRDSRM